MSKPETRLAVLACISPFLARRLIRRSGPQPAQGLQGDTLGATLAFEHGVT